METNQGSVSKTECRKGRREEISFKKGFCWSSFPGAQFDLVSFLIIACAYVCVYVSVCMHIQDSSSIIQSCFFCSFPHTGERSCQVETMHPSNFVSEAACEASRRHIMYHKVSQSTGLPDSSVMRRQEERLVRPERCGFGETNQSKKNKNKGLPQCQQGSPSGSPPPPQHTHTPLPPALLTLWSRRERSRAWRCRWRCWSSWWLSVVVSSAPPGSAGEHWEQEQIRWWVDS